MILPRRDKTICDAKNSHGKNCNLGRKCAPLGLKVGGDFG